MTPLYYVGTIAANNLSGEMRVLMMLISPPQYRQSIFALSFIHANALFGSNPNKS